jgi:hypothetical protein
MKHRGFLQQQDLCMSFLEADHFIPKLIRQIFTENASPYKVVILKLRRSGGTRSAPSPLR